MVSLLLLLSVGAAQAQINGYVSTVCTGTVGCDGFTDTVRANSESACKTALAQKTGVLVVGGQYAKTLPAGEENFCFTYVISPCACVNNWKDGTGVPHTTTPAMMRAAATRLSVDGQSLSYEVEERAGQSAITLRDPQGRVVGGVTIHHAENVVVADLTVKGHTYEFEGSRPANAGDLTLHAADGEGLRILTGSGWLIQSLHR